MQTSQHKVGQMHTDQRRKSQISKQPMTVRLIMPQKLREKARCKERLAATKVQLGGAGGKTSSLSDWSRVYPKTMFAFKKVQQTDARKKRRRCQTALSVQNSNPNSSFGSLQKTRKKIPSLHSTTIKTATDFPLERSNFMFTKD